MTRIILLSALFYMLVSPLAFAQDKLTEKQAAEQKALTDRIANIYKAEGEVNSLMERVCQSLKVSRDLTNSDRCRQAARQFVLANPLPDDDGLNVKLYKLYFSEAICSVQFVDEQTDTTFKRNSKQDNIDTTLRNCWGAVISHLELGQRANCNDENDAIACYINIVKDVQKTTELQLIIKKQADAEVEKERGASDQQLKTH